MFTVIMTGKGVESRTQTTKTRAEAEQIGQQWCQEMGVMWEACEGIDDVRSVLWIRIRRQ